MKADDFVKMIATNNSVAKRQLSATLEAIKKHEPETPCNAFPYMVSHLESAKVVHETLLDNQLLDAQYMANGGGGWRIGVGAFKIAGDSFAQFLIVALTAGILLFLWAQRGETIKADDVKEIIHSAITATQ